MCLCVDGCEVCQEAWHCPFWKSPHHNHLPLPLGNCLPRHWVGTCLASAGAAHRGFLQSGLRSPEDETLRMPGWETQGSPWGDVSPGNLSHQSLPAHERLVPTCFLTMYGTSPKCSLPVNSTPETTSPWEVTHAALVTRALAHYLLQFTTITV